MYKVNFNKPIHVHFIGIGGISMSGLAEILLKQNFILSGSDSQASPITEKLASLGATIAIGQRAENISSDIDLVVYTAAIHEDNEEFQEAVRRNIPMLTRAQLLGEIMDNYKNSIAVSGTHGKTTTTSMLSHILLEANTDPTISVGGILDRIDGNIYVGHSDVFLTEACEYTNSFLEFHPKYSIILNIEEDHMDFFKDLADIQHSFKQFASQTADDGLLVLNSDIECIPYITEDLNVKYVTFGLSEDSTYKAENIVFDDFGNAHFDFSIDGVPSGHIDLSVKGEHNVYNALSAIAVAQSIGVSLDDIQTGLLSFGGTKRRFERKGELNGFTIIDDYAHHPTEIKATLKSAKTYPHNEIWCIFQPHTYSRTKAFLNGFAEALSYSDHVILTDIYAAREPDTGEVSSKDIFNLLAPYEVDAHYIPAFEDIMDFVLKNCKKNDLLITMGAGNVVNIGEMLLKK